MRAIADEYDLMLELMVNHISPASDQFQDFLAKGDASEFADMFIDWRKFWGSPGGALQSLSHALASECCILTLHALCTTRAAKSAATLVACEGCIQAI